MKVHSRFFVLLCLALLSTFPLLASDLNFEDCHTGFAAYLAASPYILNPASADRPETEIVAVFEHAAGKTYGAIPYRLEILSAQTGRVVYAQNGGGDLELGTPLEATFRWKGVDQNGKAVPDGEYRIRMISQLFLGERWASRPSFVPRFTENENGSIDGSGDTIFNSRGSEIRVVVDRAGKFDSLFTSAASKAGAQVQRASLDPSFPYNFFFGTTHAHTNWSDGGMPVSSCTSGHYGYVGGAQPVDAFNYAKTTGGLDYIAVVEHNHLMDDACSGCTAAQVLSRYAAGFQAAQTATVAGSFVGLFGMEWGVISNGGHINVYNQSKLISWTGEPADVTVTKSAYAELYTAMKNNQGTLGSYGSFCHPNSTDYNSYARSADGDAVVRGLAILSGPAFSTSTTFTPGGSTYVDQYNKALSFGWKVAPEAHQDNHCQTYGTATPNRTVVVVPTTTTFTQQSLMAAYNGRHFYASQDRDAQLVYRTSDGTRVMGDVFSASSAVGVTVGVSDPASEGVQKIEIWGGKVGTPAAPGAAAAIVASNTSATTLTASLATHTAGEEWYYYAIATQADGDNIWSAPMWITWGSGGCTLPTTPSLSSPAAGATNVAVSTSLSWSAVSGATSYDVYFAAGSTPAFYQNTASTSVAVSGLQNSATYSWYVIAKNSCGSGPAAATRSFTTVAGSTGTPTITCGQTLSGALATTDPKSTVKTTSYADTYNFSGTSGTTVTITLNSTAFDAYAVLKNASGTVLAQDDDGNGGTNSKIVFALTASGTYSIEATSYAASATGAYTVTLACSTPPQVVTILSEGAESGATGWTYTANSGSGWSNETSTDSHAGTHRFRTNAAYTTYVNSADWSVISPAFSLSGKTAATLTYYYKFSTEASYDFFIVEVSKDGGATWTQLSKSSGKSSGYSAWAPQASVSLTPYVGNANCKIRFRLTSDTSVADWGAAVDDIVITAQ